MSTNDQSHNHTQTDEEELLEQSRQAEQRAGQPETAKQTFQLPDDSSDQNNDDAAPHEQQQIQPPEQSHDTPQQSDQTVNQAQQSGQHATEAASQFQRQADQTEQKLEEIEKDVDESKQRLEKQSGGKKGFTVAGYSLGDLVMAPVKPPHPDMSHDKHKPNPDAEQAAREIDTAKQQIHTAKEQLKQAKEQTGKFTKQEQAELQKLDDNTPDRPAHQPSNS